MNLRRVLDNLTAVIPTPRRKAPKPAQSFASLKVGQRLVNSSQRYIGEINKQIPAGTAWLVAAVSDQDAILVWTDPDTMTTVHAHVDRDWREQFERAPARKRGKRVAQGGSESASDKSPAGEEASK